MRGAARVILVALGIVGAAVLIGGLGFTIFLSRAMEDAFGPGGEPAAAPLPARIHFLQHDGFDTGAPGAALVLHPLATGGETLVVSDPRVLAAAAETAYFTDDPGRELGLVMLSILFASPPGTGTSHPFVTLFQDGREVGTYTCFRLHCRDAGADRNLAGLIDAGRPAVSDYERVSGVAAIRARAEDLQDDPMILLTAGTEQLPEQADRFDGFVWLDLPSIMEPFDPDTGHDPAPLLAEVEAELAALLDALQIDAEIGRIDSGLTWSTYQIRRDGIQATTADGWLVTDGYLPVVSPTAQIWIAADDVPALAAEIGRFDRFLRAEPPDAAAIDARIPGLIAQHGLDGVPEDFEHFAEVFSFREATTLSAFTEPEIYFGFYRLDP